MTNSLEDNLKEIAAEHGFLARPNRKEERLLRVALPFGYEVHKIFGFYDYTKPKKVGRLFRKTVYPLVAAMTITYSELAPIKTGLITYFDSNDEVEECKTRTEAFVSDLERRISREIHQVHLVSASSLSSIVTFDPMKNKYSTLKNPEFYPGTEHEKFVLREGKQ